MESSQNDSLDSSGIHSSQDGSFSQVTSAARSDSAKRLRPQIEDADRESRQTSRVRSASITRAQRSASSSKAGRTPSVRRSQEKSKGSGGSPQDRQKTVTADEELDEKIREMQNQDRQLRSQLKMLEDENLAEKVMFSSQMRSIKDEYTEFDRQYNHVLDCWRQADERSKTFEMELRSEMRLFQETREYITEMQHQFGHVVQEDYGASLRIQELEGLINRERSTFQSNAERFAQESYQEFAELRDQADRIRLEASEAIAAKDSQRLQERELISDEALKLHQRNNMLVSELSFAQNDAIQAAHVAHDEQRVNDSLRKRVTEEEVTVRNLAGEMNVLQTYLNFLNG